MIRYDLRCDAGHGFDGWFRSSGDFDGQSAGGLLSCPVCGSAAVAKALMAPAVSTKRARMTGGPASDPATSPAQEVALVDDKQRELRKMLRDLRSHMTENSEDVGDRFPEIARKMHAEEIEQKTVHGRTTAEEAKALIDEGVPVQPLPTFPDEMN